jgi:transglutaminase-like putative cysteine protease
VRVAVTHLSRLEYDADIVESIMDIRLGPLEDPHQRIEQFSLRLEPGGHARRYVDGFGNAGHLLTSMRPHAYLQVAARSDIRTLLLDPFALPDAAPAPMTPIERADYMDPSPLVPRLESLDRMAARFSAGDFDAVRGMSEMIHRGFIYEQGVTDVSTTVEQIIDGRKGVCQDFAHLLIGLCRAIGVPARYVSGYIVQSHDSPRRGAGASHAWAEVYTPSHGWRGFDPTNNLVANGYYVKIAIGRDYADVPPTRGTFRGTASETLAVSVTTEILEG